MVTPSFKPSPTRTCSAKPVKRSTNSSYTFSCTRKRVGETQTWPALRNLAVAICRAAASTSASANTSTGAWPPSSMVARFMCWPASAASILPTGVEPVNVTLRITGWGIRCSLISAGTPNTRPMTPAST